MKINFGYLIMIICLIVVYLWSLHGIDICSFAQDVNCFDRSIQMNIASFLIFLGVILIQFNEYSEEIKKLKKAK